MIQFKTNVPELDRENKILFKAASLLQQLGNDPGLSANEFYHHLTTADCDPGDIYDVTMAAISIETMMNWDLTSGEFEQPTIH
jgi:hypothetical protein